MHYRENFHVHFQCYYLQLKLVSGAGPYWCDDKPTLVEVMAWQQAITWANVDPDIGCHEASLGHNELMKINMLRMKVLSRLC